MTTSEVKLVLEKEVTCPLCMDIFKEPKKLPCDHVYCEECLKSLALRSLKRTISCPECRRVTTARDISMFPTDFRLNRLVEAFKKVRVGKELDTLDLSDTCQAHPAQPFALYCETCKKQVCRDCVLKTSDHVAHEFGFFEDVAPRYRKVVFGDFEGVRSQNEIISCILEKLATTEIFIKVQAEKCQDCIDNSFDELVSVLTEYRLALKDEATAYYKSVAKTIKHQKEHLEAFHKDLRTLTTSVDCALQENDQKFLSKLESVSASINLLKERLPLLPMELAEPQVLAVKVMNKEALSLLRHHLKSECFLYKPVNPKMCTVEGSFLTNATIGQQDQLMVTLADSLGNVCQSGENLVRVDLVSYQAKATEGIIKALSPGRFKVMLTPQVRGQHTLNVKVNGAHIRDSPFPVMVKMPIQMYSNPVTEIAGLKQPVGLACFPGEKVIATEMEQNRIIEIDSQFRVKELCHLVGMNKLTQDRELNTYVTILGDNELQKLDKSWEVVATVGQYGTRSAKFNFPNGLRINAIDELYVCDSNNHRIPVFDLDLNFKRVLGRKRRFEYPSDIDFDSSGKIYVVDCPNQSILMFSKDEHHISTFENNLLSTYKLYHPMNLFVRDNHMFVTNFGSHNILVLNITSGEMVRTIGDEYLHCPEGITIDENGFVYVTSHNSLIFVF